jgi:hypothetical protein
MLVADKPLAFSPKSAASASLKSPVDTPFKYSAGIRASTLSHPAQVLGQNGAGKLLAVPVANPGLADRDRPDARNQLSLG